LKAVDLFFVLAASGTNSVALSSHSAALGLAADVLKSQSLAFAEASQYPLSAPLFQFP